MVILEAWDRASIGLVRRGVTGEGPDGIAYGESLRRRANVSLDVALDEPLGTRPLVDAWTGEVVPRVERRSDVPLHAEAVGTPPGDEPRIGAASGRVAPSAGRAR